MEGQGLPEAVQLLLPATHAVLPSTFERHAFRDGILSTRSTHGLLIPPRTKPFVASHPSFLKVLGPAPSVRVLATGETGFAHEAGVWVDKTEEVWFTSNLRKVSTTAEVSVDISKLHVPSGQVTKVTIELVKRGNGACPYGDYILFCEQGGGPGYPSSLVAVNPLDPLDAFMVLNNFHGRAFNSLNDVIVLPSPLARDRNQQPPTTGANVASPGSTIWFTDPPYGFEQGFRHSCQLPPQVYVFEPHSGAIRVVADGFEHPNGIAFAPNSSTCYITDTSHIHGSGHLNPTLQSTIYAYDVIWPLEDELDVDVAGPSLRNRRVFAFADSGVPDGIKCDTQGNVYAGCGDGIHVWNKHGTLIGRIVLGLADGNVGAGCANFCFIPGGRLVCFSEDRIYLVIGLAVEGALL